MRRRHLGGIALALVSGCAPDPRPGPVRAMAPRPNPPARPKAPAPRQDWAGRFWEELTPAQQRLVTARLPAPSGGDAAARWDVMALSEREALLRGRAAPAAQLTARQDDKAPATP